MNYSTIIRNTRQVFGGGFKNRFAIMLMIAALFTINTTRAQVVATVNIVSQPLWGPVNYDYVDYYYMPEAGVYYYVPTNQFIYPSGGNWMFAPSLPVAYSINLFSTYKAVLNIPTPYLQHVVYFNKYAKYKKVKSRQVVIRDSRNAKYFVVKGHPKHGKANAAKPQKSKPATVKAKSGKPASAAKPKSSGGGGSNGKSSGGKGKK